MWLLVLILLPGVFVFFIPQIIHSINDYFENIPISKETIDRIIKNSRNRTL